MFKNLYWAMVLVTVIHFTGFCISIAWQLQYGFIRYAEFGLPLLIWYLGEPGFFVGLFGVIGSALSGVLMLCEASEEREGA